MMGHLNTLYLKIYFPIRSTPYAFGFFLFFLGLGVELWRTRYPLDAWPDDVDMINRSNGHYVVAVGIMISGILMITGQIAAWWREWGKTTKIWGLWLGFAISAIFQGSIVRLYVTDNYYWPEIAFAFFFWGIWSIPMGLGLLYEYHIDWKRGAPNGRNHS